MVDFDRVVRLVDWMDWSGWQRRTKLSPMLQNNFCSSCCAPRSTGVHPHVLPIQWVVGWIWRRIVGLSKKFSLASLWISFWSSLFNPFIIYSLDFQHLWNYQRGQTSTNHNCRRQQGWQEKRLETLKNPLKKFKYLKNCTFIVILKLCYNFWIKSSLKHWRVEKLSNIRSAWFCTKKWLNAIFCLLWISMQNKRVFTTIFEEKCEQNINCSSSKNSSLLDTWSDNGAAVVFDTNPW